MTGTSSETISPPGRLRRHSRRRSKAGWWRLVTAGGLGFVTGLVLVLFRFDLVPEQFNRDSQKIWRIANQVDPSFFDTSFTPVATVYRTLGLAGQPVIAGLVGYLVACVAIVLALVITGRLSASYPFAVFVFGAFVLSAIYLGQYSKDVFVLPVVIVLLLMPAKIWWDIPIVGAIALYAYWFRDYWFIVALAYVAYRVITLWQVRLRWLLVGGASAAAAVGIGLWVMTGHAPNYYRVRVISTTDTVVNTTIQPLAPLPSPWGGIVDIFANYWLIHAPLLLPFTAGAVYAVVALGVAFIRIFPLAAARSGLRWPARGSRDGALLRRSLALLLAFSVVQALFEPDYGSTIRHVTPLLPLGIAIVQASRAGRLRVGTSPWWSWTGAARVVPAESADASAPRA